MKRTMSQQERRAIEHCLFMVHPPEDHRPQLITPSEIDREAGRILKVRARDAERRAIIEGIKWGLLIVLTLAALFF